MLPEDSLQCSQEPVSSPYPDLDQSSPRTQFYSLKIYFNIIFPSPPMSSKFSFPSGFRTEEPACTLTSYP